MWMWSLSLSHSLYQNILLYCSRPSCEDGRWLPCLRHEMAWGEYAGQRMTPVPGRMEQDGSRVHPATQNIAEFKTYKLFLDFSI